MRFRTAALGLLLCTILAACSSSKPPEAPPSVLTPMPQTGKFSQDYIDQLEALCYAKIQRSVGETRAGRGLIWAECLRNRVMPIEQRNNPQYADEIKQMYDSLVWDMQKFYQGHTTLKLLHARWEARQRAIGYTDIRVFRDSYI